MKLCVDCNAYPHGEVSVKIPSYHFRMDHHVIMTNYWMDKELVAQAPGDGGAAILIPIYLISNTHVYTYQLSIRSKLCF